MLIELQWGMDLLRSQPSPLDADWLARFREESKRHRKYAADNHHDETRRTLPKTNERDRRNQPVPANVIGRHFGTFK